MDESPRKRKWAKFGALDSAKRVAFKQRINSISKNVDERTCRRRGRAMTRWRCLWRWVRSCRDRRCRTDPPMYSSSPRQADLKRMGLLKPIVDGRIKAITWKRDDGGLDKLGKFSLAKHLEGEVRIFRTSFDEASVSIGLEGRVPRSVAQSPSSQL